MRKAAQEGIPCQSLTGPFYLEATDITLPPRLPDHFQGTVMIGAGLLLARISHKRRFWAVSS
jgi:hypothetical protein